MDAQHIDIRCTKAVFAYCFLIFFLFVFAEGRGQDSKTNVRSLLLRAKSLPDDTAKVHVLFEIGDQLISRLPATKDSSFIFFDRGIALSKSLQYDSGIVAGMVGKARIWIGLREKKRAAAADDSVELVMMWRSFEDVIGYVKSKPNSAKKKGEVYYTLASLIPTRRYSFRLRLALFESARVYYKRAGYRDGYSETLTWIGHVYHSLSDVPDYLGKARKAYQESIDVMDGAKRKGLSLPYSLMGNLDLWEGNADRALGLILKAYDLALEEDSTSVEFGLVNMFLGATYVALKDPTQAEIYYMKALSVFEKHDQTTSGDLIHAACNTAEQMMKHDPAKAIALLDRVSRDNSLIHNHPIYIRFSVSYMAAYAKIGDYVTANRYCNAAIDRPELSSIGYSLSFSEFFIVSGQYDKARKYAVLYQANARKNKQRTPLAKSFLLLYKIDSAEGKFFSAMTNFREHKLLSDSILNEKKLKEIDRLRIEYETDKKEQSLTLLTKDAEINKQKLSEANIRANVIVSALIIMAIISFLILNLYRLKKKTSDEIGVKNMTLEKLVREKEWLLKEIHHRVKNNLHIVASLLNSQSQYIKDNAAATAIRDSQNRVHSISLIHQKLYKSSNMTMIYMPEYISELVGQLRHSFNTGHAIVFKLDVEPVNLDVSRAVPLGLILNEAITNAIKYAFPQQGGEIAITLKRNGSEQWLLTIRDNGTGLPPDFDPAYTDSLGITLIKGLSEDIDGHATIISDGGTVIEVYFPDEHPETAVLNAE